METTENKESTAYSEWSFTITGDMIFNKKLKGTDLLVYAIIANFGENGFSDGLQILANCSGLSRISVIRSLKYLCEKRFLKKIGTNAYKITDTESIKMIPESIKMIPESIKMIPETPDSAEIKKSKKEKDEKKEVKEVRYIEPLSSSTLNNNRETDIESVNRSTDIENSLDNDTTKPEEIKKQKYFIPPTVEEVAAYCRERRNGINAEAFVDFYTSKGWMIGKNKMKDWKAAVRTWERTRRQGEKPPKPESKVDRENREMVEEVFRKMGYMDDE